MSNVSPSFSMQKCKHEIDDQTRGFNMNPFYDTTSVSLNLTYSQTKLCSPEGLPSGLPVGRYENFYSVAPEVMGAVAVKPELQPDANSANFNSGIQNYFPTNPNFYPFANDPFPPLGPVLNQPKPYSTSYSTSYNPKPGLLFAPPFAFDSKFDSKLDLSRSNGQPLRGNQDRDYYVNLVLEARSTDPPKHTYATLLAYAILHAPEAKMTLDQIYTWVLEYFPYFETCEKDWRNSIRHNLSLNVMFERVPRQINELGKGSYWTCRPENAKKELDSMRMVRKPRKQKPAFMPNLRGRFGFDSFNMPSYSGFGLRPLLDRQQRTSHNSVNAYQNFNSSSTSFQSNSFQPLNNSSSYSNNNLLEQQQHQEQQNQQQLQQQQYQQHQQQSFTSHSYNIPFSSSYASQNPSQNPSQNASQHSSQNQFQSQNNPSFNHPSVASQNSLATSHSTQNSIFQPSMSNYPPPSQSNNFYSYFPPTPISNNNNW